MVEVPYDLTEYWKNLELEKRLCKNCGKVYQPVQPTQKYCGIRCKETVKQINQRMNNTEGYQRRLVRQKKYAKEWRKRMKKENKCVRCGNYKISSNNICSECLTQMSSRRD